jgi:hypothetical protein
MRKDSFAFDFKVNVLETFIYFLILIFYGLILQTGTI